MKNLHGLSGGWSHGASAGSSRLVNRQEVCIINALPLTEQEELKFKDVASGAQQYFVGDEGLDKDLPSELTDKATVILGNLQVSQVKRCKRIAWLQTASAGVNNYEMDGVLPKTAMITSASGAYGQEVSEHMFAMMWALMKRLPNYRDQQRENIWQDRGPVATVRGAKVLIVGTGDIGSHFAQLVKAVGGKTIGIRRDARKTAPSIDTMFGFKDLDKLLPQVDVVALVVPSSPDTYHILNRKRLSLIRSHATIINAGRGDAVDCQALAEYLAAGSIGAAGLDVTEPEPLPKDHQLWNEPQCLITPHIAGGYHLPQARTQAINIALDNVQRYLSGLPLRNRLR